MHSLKKYKDQELADLISKSKRKREKAFSELYFRYENKLYNHIRYLCNDNDVTNDITQQTWLKFYNCIIDGNILTNTYSFLLSISHNIYKNHLRDKKQTIPWETDIIEIQDFENSMYHEFEKNIDKEELLTIVQFSLDVIDVKDREVIVYKKLDGLTYKEIGEIFNISSEGAKKRYERAIAKLNKVLNPYLKEMYN